MATTYKGLYLFPLTESINMSCLYFESDATSGNESTIRTEINNILRSMSSIQGSVLNARKNSISYACTEHFHNISMNVYFTPYVDGSYYVNTSDTYIGGTQFLYAPGTGYIAAIRFLMLVKTLDNHYCLGSVLYTLNSQDASDMLGLSAPSGASPGYAIIDMPPSPTLSLYGYNQTTALRHVNDYFTGNPPVPSPIQSTDPYTEGGTTESGGGEGDFTDTTSPIDFPTMPTFSAVDTGFITIFNPTTAQLKSLADYMWAGLFDINAYRKIFADPGDAILGLSVVPCAVPHSDTPREIVVGNIPTGITMNVATAQYVDIDCGTLNISEYWGAYLDYSPYTKFEIYLPFIGMRPLSADDVMAKQIHLKYRIDILSGTCVAFIKCGDSVLYTFQGQCSATIPITGNDWSTAIMAAVSVACSAVATVATGGLAAPATAGSAAALGASAATGIASAANQIKPEIQKSGAMSGVGGMLGIQTPFLILTRPRQALPERQNTFTGYPSFVTETLGDLEGYTEVAYIHLENIPATTSEINELESILKTGVIL